MLIWHRSPAGPWDQPVLFTHGDLRLEHGLTNVQLRADGRMAIIEGQIMSFDPDYLLAYSRRLSNGIREAAVKE